MKIKILSLENEKCQILIEGGMCETHISVIAQWIMTDKFDISVDINMSTEMMLSLKESIAIYANIIEQVENNNS